MAAPSKYFCVISAQKTDGAMQLTLILCWPHSQANALASMCSASFDEQYALNPE
jgi:hypothetical protein